MELRIYFLRNLHTQNVLRFAILKSQELFLVTHALDGGLHIGSAPHVRVLYLLIQLRSKSGRWIDSDKPLTFVILKFCNFLEFRMVIALNMLIDFARIFEHRTIV